MLIQTDLNLWTKRDADVIASGDAQKVASNGNGSALHYLIEPLNGTGKQTFQLDVQRAELDWLDINFLHGTQNNDCYFNLKTHQAGSIAAGVTAKITRVSETVDRIQLTKTLSMAGQILIVVASGDGVLSPTVPRPYGYLIKNVKAYSGDAEAVVPYVPPNEPPPVQPPSDDWGYRRVQTIGSADDTAALQAALDAGGVLDIGNRTAKLKGQLRLDPTKSSISGVHGVLDFSGVTLPASPSHASQQAALLILTPAGRPRYGQGPSVVSGVTLLGPSGDGSVDGIGFHTPAEGQSSRTTLDRVSITQFRKGIVFHDRAYLVKARSVDVYACSYGVDFPTTQNDSGEQIVFHDAALFNCGVALRNDGGAGIRFFGGSFDYNQCQVNSRGTVEFHGVHFEQAKPTRADLYPFIFHSSAWARFFGGLMQISETGEPVVDYIFSTPTPPGFPATSVRLKGVWTYNMRSKNGELAASVPGTVVIEP